ncbi:UPF0104 family protein [Methanothermobacter wolfeii]|uniref:UPF0104 family protein n=1 Tax=Methanothermobacter wolfeii TaxID=145261 RepID=UPI0024B34446|nr:UPF0104 family protein [Methanothermobacter wolfeii]MDI6701651.1 UPF0104 family protein [Methanothermobacter wolfeii]MDI6842456.1 UPF0104 family protein [Methanothermobacter wolfeii]
MKKAYFFILSFFLILLVIFWIGPSRIIYSVSRADLLIILMALAVHIMVLAVRGLRWGFIIGQTGRFRVNFIVKTIGLFAGNLSPMRSAGEVMNALAGKKLNGIQLSEGLSAGLTERFFDLGIGGFLLIAAAVLMPQVRIAALFGAVLSLLITYLIYLVNWREEKGLKIYERIHSLLERLPISERTLDNLYVKLTEGIRNMIGYTRAYSNFTSILVIFSLSLLSWLMECLRLYLVFLAFGVEVAFSAVIIIFLLANLIGILSALPGGMGSMEVSLTALFVLFGVQGSVAGSIAIVDRLISFWFVTALGVVFSSYYARDILEEVKSGILDVKS